MALRNELTNPFNSNKKKRESRLINTMKTSALKKVTTSFYGDI